jgi:hypothetical protein
MNHESPICYDKHINPLAQQLLFAPKVYKNKPCTYHHLVFTWVKKVGEQLFCLSNLLKDFTNYFTRYWKTTYGEKIHIEVEINFPFGTKSQEVCSFHTLLWSLLNYFSLTLKFRFYSHKSPCGSHWLVQVGKKIVNDVLLNGGFRINIISFHIINFLRIICHLLGDWSQSIIPKFFRCKLISNFIVHSLN